MGGPGSGRRKGDASLAPTVERFWSKVRITDGCWEWTGGRRTRYGYFHTGRNSEQTHRLSFEMAYGPIPDGMLVCHTCDNPPCVRPSHLFLGTIQDNVADATAKGRMASGARSGWVTTPERMLARRPPIHLPDVAVAGIYRSVAAGESMGSIARRLNASTSAVSRIAGGKRRAVRRVA